VRLSLICRVLLSIENTPLGCLIILDGQNFPPLSRHLPAKNRRVGRYYAYIKLGYPYKPSHLPACFRGRVHSSLQVTMASDHYKCLNSRPDSLTAPLALPCCGLCKRPA
jgi:hypothetical protein